MRGTLRRLLLGAAMAGIALVVGFRAAEQLKRPGAMTAHGEKLWFGWAYRDPALLARLENAEHLLRPGDVFCLEFDSRQVDPTWLQSMTNYAFWREIPAGPCPAGSRTPMGLTRVVISAEGRVGVVRGSRR